MAMHHSIIRKPLLTEKSTLLREDDKYVVQVDKDATKIEIKEAFEALFDVKVVSVNTMNVIGKKKRQGRFEGKRADWKKAIVKVTEGAEIAAFGEM